MQQGGINSKFFHAVETSRRRKILLTGLYDVASKWTSNFGEMSILTISYFECMFTSAGSRDYEACFIGCSNTLSARANRSFERVYTR